MLKKIMIRILLSIVSIESVVALSDYDQYLVAANRENLSNSPYAGNA